MILSFGGRMPKSAVDWTQDQIDFIKKRTIDAQDGHRIGARLLSKCPELLGRTESNISELIRKFGWADKVRSNRIKFASRLSPSKKAEILEFLRGEGRHLPSSMIVKKFRIKKRQLNRLRKANDLVFHRGPEALANPSYRRIYNSQKKARRIAAGQAAEARRNEIEVSLREKEANLKRQRNLGIVLIKTRCTNCQKRWPKNNVFFYELHCRTKKGVKFKKLSSVCRVCRKESIWKS